MKIRKTAAVAAIALALAGCLGHGKQPTTAAIHQEAVAAKLSETRQHIQKGITLLDIKPLDVPVIKTELKTADNSAAEAQKENQQAKDETTQLAEALAAKEKELQQVKTQAKADIATEQGKTKAEEAKRKAAEEKYASAWFGGKFWFWVKTISAVSGLLAIAGLLLNYYTDFFVIIAKPLVAVVVGIIGGAVKVIWQALAYCGKAAAKLWQKQKT